MQAHMLEGPYSYIYVFGCLQLTKESEWPKPSFSACALSLTGYTALKRFSDSALSPVNHNVLSESYICLSYLVTGAVKAYRKTTPVTINSLARECGVQVWRIGVEDQCGIPSQLRLELQAKDHLPPQGNLTITHKWLLRPLEISGRRSNLEQLPYDI